MKILGITSPKSVLVSFDPSTGSITEKHAWLSSKEDFVGLAYDSNQNRLYALSQSACNLYCINPLTRDVTLIGKLSVAQGADASALAYNAADQSLYTVVLTPGGGGNYRSDLGKINTGNATLTIVGKIADGICNSLAWRECDGKLNGYIIYGSGAWDSPYKASVISIDPTSASVTNLFNTTYHTIMGLARKPGQDAYVSWINWTTHFYGEVDLANQGITQMAASDGVGVTTPAMIYRNFYVAPAPNLPPCSFSDDDCLGS